MAEKLNFFKKTAPNFWIGLYLQPAVDRQPGHRREDREEVGRKIYIVLPLDCSRII